MNAFTEVKITDNDINSPVRALLRGMLEKGLVDAVMAPALTGGQEMPRQTLIVDPALTDSVDALAPVVPWNAAQFVSRLTGKPSGRRLAVVMRSCESRAFTELIKLNQGSADALTVIGLDCLGRLETKDYLAFKNQNGGTASSFVSAMLKGEALPDGVEPPPACKTCEYPETPRCDLRVCLAGSDTQQSLFMEAVSERGEQIFRELGWQIGDGPAGREAALSEIKAGREAARDAMYEEFDAKTQDMAALSSLLSNCVNCYNCRNACPVCYCRVCVFQTDTFRHDSEQYFNWADKRGALKMPTDTLFYHLTRMIHMSTSCVGCGQCSSACPSELPLAQIFRSVARKSQAAFDYVPGRDADEPLPLAVFGEGEFLNVTNECQCE